MMIGPMKKKMITTGVIAFLVPTIIIGALFGAYAKRKKEEIAALELKAESQMAYVFSGDFAVNHVVSMNDVALVETKSETAPVDAYLQGDLSFIGRKLKVAVNTRTIVMNSLFLKDEDEVSVDLRSREFNMISLPSNLKEGDFIDIRILYPTGEDYLVVAGKEIMSTGALADSNSIFLELNEEEILRVSGAIIESYIADGINLYATKYVNPVEQLYEYVSVDYVEKYNNAVEILQERYKEIIETEVSGDPIYNESGDLEGYKVVKTKEEKVPAESDLDLDEIVSLCDCQMNKEDARAIRSAKEKNDTALLGAYANKTDVYSKALTPNYPVRPEVAKLLAQNPNIVEEIRQKYGTTLDLLEKQRENLNDTNYKTYDEMTGLYIEDDSKLSKIQMEIDNEIQAQKSDRKQYLQNLIRGTAY